MIAVTLSPSLRESARRRHLNALLTLPAEFGVVEHGADIEVAERGTPRGSAPRRVLVGPRLPADADTDLCDTPVEWDRAVLDFVERISALSGAVRALTIITWADSEDAPRPTITEALDDAACLASRILPPAEVSWVTTTGVAAESRSGRQGEVRVILSAVETHRPSRWMRVQLTGDGVAATLDVSRGETARPSRWSIATRDGSEASSAPFSSSARELWLAVAAGG